MKRNLGLVPQCVLLTATAGLALGVYLMISQATYHAGFPLDDAWIHQTYARNLAKTGDWAFIPGKPSAGSTSPLWSLLLTLGYLVGLAPLAWANFLGWLALAGLAWMAQNFGLESLPKLAAGLPCKISGLPWMGLFIAGEWHLVWAAGSGMETVLFAFAVMTIFWLLAQKHYSAFLIGLICGFTTWIRPDGLTTAGPILLVVLLRSKDLNEKVKAGTQVIGAIAIGLIPYLFFNYTLGGSWWPNTLYAKQAEYAIMQQISFMERYLHLIFLPMIGSGILLLPGLGYAIWAGWKNRLWALLSAVVWWLGYTAIYAAALPVEYQHGRYLIPAMPVFFSVGLIGTIGLIQKLVGTRRKRLMRFAAIVMLGFTWLIFFLQGSLVYSEDVAIIESEMVPVGRWIAANTPADALIAVHDIGAVGYFGQRNLIDLAGLISPEVIPFIRDETRLAVYLDQHKADYLVTFPNWYPDLVHRSELIFQSGGSFSPKAGGENMAVYRWIR